MRIHHLNCISTCPLGGKLMDGQADSIVRRGHLVCHCLLVETERHGLVLVDTGFGLNDVRAPRSRLSEFFLMQLKPEFREEMTAVRQIETLGFAPRDVRNIVLTHLDFDHAGGLDDFPWATVHLMQEERDYALKQKTWLDRQRYRMQQWSTSAHWKVYRGGQGDEWYGFTKVHELEGVPLDICLVPLRGHTFGHAGVAIPGDTKWQFLVGDAYFYHEEMSFHNPHCTPGLRLYQTMMEKDRFARLKNQRRLRQLKHQRGGEVEIFCGHDVVEFERLSGRSAEVPASRFAQRRIA